MHDSVDMLSTDTHITFRLFLDTAVAEAYFMGGRVAMTIPVRLPACRSGWLHAMLRTLTPTLRLCLCVPMQVPAATTVWNVSITADHAVQLANASSWSMSSIYVSKAEVLATPRRDVWG